jgi:hypothetical protein
MLRGTSRLPLNLPSMPDNLSSHTVAIIHCHDRVVLEETPYTLSSSVVAAIVVAYLLLILFLLVLYSS